MYRKRRSPFLRRILRGSDAKRTCRSTCSIDKLSTDRRRTRPPRLDDAVESERHDGARGRAPGGGAHSQCLGGAGSRCGSGWRVEHRRNNLASASQLRLSRHLKCAGLLSVGTAITSYFDPPLASQSYHGRPPLQHLTSRVPSYPPPSDTGRDTHWSSRRAKMLFQYADALPCRIR